ncbi:MAG: lipid-A-disaccharide synthase [Gammaproteobacteria bacterium]
MTNPQKLHIGIITGEVSGDLLGADLIRALREHIPEVTFEGVLGPELKKLGGVAHEDMESLAVMGFVDPLLQLPKLLKIRHKMIQHFKKNPPDVFIGIDSPDFNLGVEYALKKTGIKTVHYVSPSVWAWRKGRIKKIKKAVDLMLTLFPFEKAFYDDHGVNAVHVGHPLADMIPMENDKLAARARLYMPEEGEYVALLPGSRKNELSHLAETFLETADLCLKRKPELKFITACANAARREQFESLWRERFSHIPLTFYDGQSRDVMMASDAILVTSGTATLEAMLVKRPTVVAYKMSKLNFFVARLLVDIAYFSLPNLIADGTIMPEFLQDDANPEQLSKTLLEYFLQPEIAKAQIDKFKAIHGQLMVKSSQKAAISVINLSFS